MKILDIMKVPYYKKGKVINKNKSQNVETPVDNEETYFLGTLPEVEITTSASPETIKKGWEQQTNEWALQNPTAIFKPKYRKQRAVLTDDTWEAIIKANNITDPADKRFKMIPTKFQEQAMQGNVRKAINEDGVKLAGLVAAVPGAIIGGGALANPVLSQMFYHPGTFLAETIGGTIGGYIGGAATDAVTRGLSNYDSFADMIASNSTIPEQYAEMLNPGMLLGGLAGGVGGNVLYNTVKPLAKKTITGHLAARGFNKSINENLGRLKFHDSNPQEIPLIENYLYHETPGQQFNRDGSRAWPSIAQLNIKDGKYVSARKPHGNNPDKIWWDSSGHNTGTEVYVKPKENELNVLENMSEINYSPGSFSDDYYISDPVNVDEVIKYKKDPITGQYNISVPGKTVTNKTLDPSNLDYVEFSQPSNSSVSLKFYERPSTLTEAERLGIPKGERNLKTTNTDAFNFHLKNLKNDLGHGKDFVRDPITWEQQINNLKSDELGEFIGSGSESIVYEHPTNKKIVLKVIKSAAGENDISLNYLNNIISQRNHIPLQLPQYLYGRIKIGDYYYPVMQQKKVIPVKDDLQTYIPTLQKLLKPHGFYLKDGKFTNDIYTIGDLSKGNIGITPNGHLRFIDVQKWKQGGTINPFNPFNKYK